MSDNEGEFLLEYEPSALSRSLIALDPAVTTPECESKIKGLRIQAQDALLSDIQNIRSMFAAKRDELRRSYEASLSQVDQAEVVAVRSYFESMFAHNQSWLSRVGTLVGWLFGGSKQTAKLKSL